MTELRKVKIKEKIYHSFNCILNYAGLDLRRYPSRSRRALIKYLAENQVHCCIDAGANTGQFASGLRSSGFHGAIISFEPQKAAFDKLSRKAQRDGKWATVNAGLGDKDTSAILNISANSVSSSILPMEERTTLHVAEASYIANEEIKVFRLDSFMKAKGVSERVFLKIDTQGYEAKILDGASSYFEHIFALQLETSFVRLYRGEILFDEMKRKIEDLGFYVSSVECEFIDETNGMLLQADIVFLRDIHRL